jgi:predicted O-methyltransferase YrrM
MGDLRTRWRRLQLGLSTLLTDRPRGFFIPYRHADQVTAALDYGAAARAFRQAQPQFIATLDAVEAVAPDLERISGTAEPPEPRWNQDWLVTLDAAVLYAMLWSRRPKRVVEVGSGHSTRFIARAIRDGALATQVTAIDPKPRADISRLKVTQLRGVVQAADPAIFAALEAGDILFIDSSHILMPGTDVDLLLNGVLPLLPSGALVHVHDIFLPEDYPAGWRWRGYNEQLGVMALIAGGGWQPLFASNYAKLHLAEQLGRSVIARLPGIAAPASSLWLQKR